MKRILCLLLLFCLLLPGCTAPEKSDKLTIVTVSFPGYSFAKEIAGDKAEIVMLLPLGSEAHGYEPTPKDMMKIQECDVFIYGGGESEHWVEEVLASTDGSMQKIAMLDCVPHIAKAHEGHDHGADEHVWTSPKNAMEIVRKIGDAVCTADPENKEFYKKSEQEYLEKLAELDAGYREAFAGKNAKIVMADRFPFLYMAEEYGFSYTAAFPGCAGESEPGAAKVAELIDLVKEQDIAVVYYTEFSNREVADVICEATGAKARMLHSCHNLLVEDFEKGESYFSLMQRNLNNLKEAL